MILVSTALLLGTPFSLPVEDTDAQNVLRVYDVSNLAMNWEESEEGRYMMPFFEVGDDHLDEHSEPDRNSIDSLVDTLLELQGAEFEYAGRYVHLTGDARLLVRGPEDLQENVKQVIEFMDSAINAQVTLAVDTFRIGPAEGPAAGVMTTEDADRWMTANREESEHRQHLVNVRRDRFSNLDLGRIERALVDYDVEIAQGSAISDPIVIQVHTGTRLKLGGAPAGGGDLHLTYQIEEDRRLPGWVYQINQQFWAGSESTALTLRRDSSVLTDLRVMSSRQAATSLLPAGQVLVLTNRIECLSGAYDEVIFIRQQGGGFPTRHELPLGSGGKLIFADIGAIEPPYMEATGALFDNRMRTPNHRMNYEPILRVQLSGGRHDMVDVLHDLGQDYTGVDTIGRFLISRPHDGALMEDPEHVVAEQNRLIEAFDQLVASPTVYDVTIVAEGEYGQAKSRLPLKAGGTAAVVLGAQSLEVFDHDVEVAQFAAVPDMQMITTLDGMVAWMRISESSGDKLVVDFVAGAQFVTEGDKLELGGHGPIDFINSNEGDRIFVQERVTLTKVGDAWSTTFGDSTGDGPSFVLKVR